MCIVYGLNYLDKTTLSYASIMGLRLPHSDDKLASGINLTKDNYQWLGSLFYFGYIAWEYPTTRLLQILPLGKYSAFNIILWGLTLACFAAVESYEGAIAVRFFLGVFESAVTPGFALFTSQWYTKKEQGSRTAIWFSFNGWGTSLSSSHHNPALKRHSADIWWLSRIRYRRRRPQIRHSSRALENRFPRDGSPHNRRRHYFPLGCPR
jgi:MFS family permease